MKLILLGGIKGVGKTTLLAHLNNKFKRQIRLLDPGELFRHYFYNEKLKTIEEIEKLIVKKIITSPNNSTNVSHWHYAVKRPKKYIPQISFSKLKTIAKNNKIERIVLILIEAPIQDIYLRRLRDTKIKSRSLKKLDIKEEISYEKQFLTKEQKLFSRILGCGKVEIIKINNHSLQIAKATLNKLFQNLTK